MERRLQERCAELQREVFRLQGAHNNESYKSLEKRPVALPRQVLPRNNKIGSSEHDDEGISSSETGQSLSPEPIIILTQNNSKKFTLNLNDGHNQSSNDDVDTQIEDVIEELENIVQDAEREINGTNNESKPLDIIEVQQQQQKQQHRQHETDGMEKEIVPVNLLPQPPKKTRSLAHLLSSSSEFDDSDYGVLMMNNECRISYYDDIDMEIENSRRIDRSGEPNPDVLNQISTNRELLNVIMDAREKDENLFVNRPKNKSEHCLIPKQAKAPQKFNGVFFMTEMSTPQKYPKPDITAALEARRVTKSIERMESYGNTGIDSMIDIVMTTPSDKNIDAKYPVNIPQNNFQALRDMSINTTFLMRNKSPAPDSTSILFPNGTKTTRTACTINGSKLTDLPSGLY